MASVDVKGVSKNYGNITALKNVSLSLDTNGCIGILGPNGAGSGPIGIAAIVMVIYAVISIAGALILFDRKEVK